jgi:hypothetical protein
VDHAFASVVRRGSLQESLAACPQLLFGFEVTELAWLFGALLVEVAAGAFELGCGGEPYRGVRTFSDVAGRLLFELAADIGGQIAVQVGFRD